MGGIRYTDQNQLPPAYREQATQKLGKYRGAAGTMLADALEKETSSHRSEHEEQVDFFERIDQLCIDDDRYVTAARRTFAIPNGGFRDRATAGKLKAEGVKSGVADVQCAMPSQIAHGLFVEMKRKTEGYLRPAQREFIDESIRLGYVAVCCRGADEAFTAWKAYVEGTFE